MSEEDKRSKQSSRRRFLKQGTVLAGLAAVGGIQPASGQSGGQSNSEASPVDTRSHSRSPVEVKTPPDPAILRDPWDGTPLRDAEGNVLADWTGTEEWLAYQKALRASF